MKKYLVIAILSLTSIVSLSAQEEIVYNQYHFNYYLANPELAGAEPCSHFMLTNKFQWVGMDEFPMIQTLSFRTRALDRIGIGAFLYNDRNGYDEVSQQPRTDIFLLNIRDEIDLNHNLLLLCAKPTTVANSAATGASCC